MFFDADLYGCHSDFSGDRVSGVLCGDWDRVLFRQSSQLLFRDA